MGSQCQPQVSNFSVLFTEKFSPLYGTIDIYENIKSKKREVFGKSVFYHKEAKSYEIVKMKSHLQNRVHKPVINLLGIYHVDNIQGDITCGIQKGLTVYAQYIEYSLQDELRKRRNRSHDKYFTERQIWKIMASLINAIKQIHSQSSHHGEIRMSNILVGKDYYLKLVEKCLLDSKNWQVTLDKQEVVKMSKGKGILFSPLIFKCLNHKKTQLITYDPPKSDVFSIGMVMLECCSLIKSEAYYNYDKFKVDMSHISKTVTSVRLRYSSSLVDLIDRMLQDDDDQRASTDFIYKKLQSYPQTAGDELKMSFNQQRVIIDTIFPS